MTAIITLTTDFGAGSPYAAVMKGVILGISPAVRLVDISHEVPPQDVRHGAVVLAEGSTWFPQDTIHVAVVDPGVGTVRRLVYARIGDQQYLAPDNGLLSLLATRNRPTCVVELANSEHWMPTVSHTFHGRDILAPIAAQLSLGLEPERLGPEVDEIEMLDWREPWQEANRIEGEVRWIDRFGNLISNISVAVLPAVENRLKLRTSAGGAELNRLSQTYGEHKSGELIALIGSGGYLELAVVNGSAAATLNVSAGAPIIVEW